MFFLSGKKKVNKKKIIIEKNELVLLKIVFIKYTSFSAIDQINN